MIDQEQQNLISKVINGFVNNKYQLVEHLFGDAHETYKEKWRDMDGLEFWAYLDPDNRQMTIEFFLNDEGDLI